MDSNMDINMDNSSSSSDKRNFVRRLSRRLSGLGRRGSGRKLLGDALLATDSSNSDSNDKDNSNKNSKKRRPRRLIDFTKSKGPVTLSSVRSESTVMSSMTAPTPVSTSKPKRRPSKRLSWRMLGNIIGSSSEFDQPSREHATKGCKKKYDAEKSMNFAELLNDNDNKVDGDEHASKVAFGRNGTSSGSSEGSVHFMFRILPRERPKTRSACTRVKDLLDAIAKKGDEVDGSVDESVAILRRHHRKYSADCRPHGPTVTRPILRRVRSEREPRPLYHHSF